MDVTPTTTTSSLNDSGYNSGSSRSNTVKRILHFPTFESTPSSSRLKSRKRKSDNRYRKLSDILEEKQGLHVSPNSSFYDNCFSQNSSDYSKSHNQSGISFFRNSFDDGKLSSTLEKCSLEEYHSPIKKYKWDEERKSSSAPGTPYRQENQDSDNSLRKFYSLDLTPTKGTNVKIGTPERLGILYPNIKVIKSPEKIRCDIKRLRKPSNKRFQFHCRDFVHIFTHVEKVDHIIRQIFSYLPDTDLVNIAKVSKLWKKSLDSDDEAYRRYKTHLKNIIIRKENINENFNTIASKKKWRNAVASPPTDQIGGTVSPSRVNWAKFATTGAALNETQRLTKCVVCARPAVLERGLARCSGLNCAYLWCVGCLVGARTPELLDCCCQTPHSPPSPLQDKSNIGCSSTSTVVSFLSSSGYYSDDKSSKSQVLTDYNENLTQQKIPTLNSTSGFNILEHRDKIHKAKKTLSNKRNRAHGLIPEPGSPPNVKMSTAGSRQSKRNLRRLLF